MRNLRTVSVTHTRVDLSSEPDQKLQVAAYDSSRGHILFATSSGTLRCVSLTSNEIQWSLPLESSNVDDGTVKDMIVGMEFMMDQEALVVGTMSGDLLLLFLSTQSVEVVGKVEGGIVQMSSSPDGELLAVATGLGLLLLMTQDWEVLYEISLDEDRHDQGRSTESTDEVIHQANESIQISWRGDGKYFATLGGSLYSTGSSQLRIWERDTGTLHACSKAFSFMGAALDWIPSGARIASACSNCQVQKPPSILFFERNGLERGSFDIDGPLEAVERGSFDIDGPLEAVVEQIKWNCNSELLAVLLRCTDWDAIQIWSFSNYHWYLKQERRHTKGDRACFFWDPEKPMCLVAWTLSGLVQVISLCWDSAVTNESVALVIDGSCLLVTPLTLALIPPPLSLFKLKFKSPIQTAALKEMGQDNIFIAASLSNGSLSLMTLPNIDKWDALEGADYVVPDVEVSEEKMNFSGMRLLTWLDSGNLLGVRDTDSGQFPMHSDCELVDYHAHSFSNTFTTSHDKSLFSEILMEIEAHSGRDGFVGKEGLSTSSWSVKCNKQTFLDQAVLAIMANPAENGVLVHLGNGLVLPYIAKVGLAYSCPETSRDQVVDTMKKLLSPSVWVRALSVGCPETGVVVALDEKGRLQIESQIVCSDCTSFTVHFTCVKQKKVVHIVYTTKQDMLHVVNLEEVLGNTQNTDTAQDISHLSSRGNQDQGLENTNSSKREKRDWLKARPLWERGAKLITALGGCDVAVVLQTARGNLETIYPRTLVLGSIATALCQWNFNDAMLLARQHHINLNLIVDYRGWETFIQMAGEFIKQVKNISHVTELVCAVNRENVMDGVYKDLLLPYTKEILQENMEPSTNGVVSSDMLAMAMPVSQSLAQGNKVQGVLQAIRKALEEEVEKNSTIELCILTTMARSDPPELEEALQRIKKLREEEIQDLMEEVDVASPEHSRKGLSAEQALKHLLWLSDPESLFNAALGLYDLHLAAMVASNSQRDPKEFLPLLQELEKMPAPMMRYTIDYKLHRFESALKNLAAAGDSYFSKCLELIKSNPNLFQLGKYIFKDGHQRMAVLEAWGDHLLNEKRFEDAAAAFCCCSQLQKAMGAYRAGGLWQGVLVVAGMLGHPHEEVIRLAEDLREELQALGRPGEAAKVALEYCNDVEGAIHLFIEAREWIEAIRVAFSHGKGGQVKDQVQPAAVECANSYTSDFEENLEKLGKYLTRYLAVKQRRLLLATKMKMESAGDIEDDAASDISSNVSGMSAYTTGTRTSKWSAAPSSAGTGQHKQSQRKSRGGKIRAGSPGEEAALVEHLKSMGLTSGTLEEIRKLTHVLVLLGHDTMAEKLQHLAIRFQSSQQKAVIQAEEKMVFDKLQWWWEVLDVPGTAS